MHEGLGVGKYFVSLLYKLKYCTGHGDENPTLILIPKGGYLDIPKAIGDLNYLQQWVRGITNHPDLTIKRVSTLAEWRCICAELL